MSGGAVLDESGKLIGIHRGKGEGIFIEAILAFVQI